MKLTYNKIHIEMTELEMKGGGRLLVILAALLRIATPTVIMEILRVVAATL